MRQSLKTGDKAPEFSLIGADGMIHTMVDYKGFKGVCFCFLSLKCDASKKNLKEIEKLKDKYASKSIAFVCIFDKEASASFSDTLTKLKNLHLNADVLLDATGDLRAKFQVTCTPHYFIFNQSKHLIYSGCLQSDIETPCSEYNPNYIANALDQLVGGLPIKTPVTDPVGSAVQELSFL